MLTVFVVKTVAMPVAKSPLRPWQWDTENPTEHIPAVIARSDVHIFLRNQTTDMNGGKQQCLKRY
jgi:hypothetical protein